MQEFLTKVKTEGQDERMLHRMKYQFLSAIALISLTSCAQMGFVPDAPVQKQASSSITMEQPKMAPKPSIQANQNLLETMNGTTDSSVTVYPLTGDIVDPFTRKTLQPLSSKVIAEGYPVLDPSVTVYPLRPPSAVPPVSFENVDQVGANSSLYSARVQSLTAQRDIEAGSFPNFPSSNKIVTSVESEALIPLPIKPMNNFEDELEFVDVPDRATDFASPPALPSEPRTQAPLRSFDVFKKAGTVSKPEGSSSAYAPVMSTTNNVKGISADYNEPWPITRPEKTNMEALKPQSMNNETSGNNVMMPNKPSIEKIDSNTGSAIPSLTGY